jgi:hypothetical protein
MSSDENVQGILDSTDISGQSLVFTSTRLIVIKNRGAATAGSIGVILMVLLIVFFGIFIGLILGFIAILLTSKLTGKPKDYSKVSVESLLSMSQEVINYPQIEKVEIKKNKLKFFYIMYGGDRKNKQLAFNPSLYQQNLDLLNRVLFGKVIAK